MSGPNKSWELSIAEPEDSAGIQKVFDDGNFEGGISVKFSRLPDPYRSFRNDGEHIVMPIVKDVETSEILGVGGCVIRPAYVNGNLQNTGYLTGLKILQSHQNKINCIVPAFKLLAEKTAVFSPFYYTTILKSNETAIKLLEKRRKNMPQYVYIGEYTVFCLGTGIRTKSGGYTFSRGHTPLLSVFYKEYLPKYNLSPKDEWLYGLQSDDFYYLQSSDGKILAACALWNQQSYKQYTISGYSGVYKVLSHLPLCLLGYPVMPKPGVSANYASIALFVVHNEDHDIARLFLSRVLNEAGKYDFVMFGLLNSHPLLEVAEKFRHIKYQSRLYAVDYSENESQPLPSELDNRPIMLEVGLL